MPRRKRRVARNDAAPSQRTPKVEGLGSQRNRVRVAQGVYRDRWGLAATVKVDGIQREIRFPPGTPLKTVRARRDELRASLRTLPAGERYTLANDAERYLDQVAANLIGSAERRRDVEVWLARFGHLRTLVLSEHLAELNAQLHEWRRTRAVSTRNHRRHALLHLIRVLYGRRAAIDLEDLVRFALPLPRPRWIDRAHIETVLEHLAPHTKTSARLRLMHWTGMRPSPMGRLTRSDFRLSDPVPYVSVPRGKGGRLAAIPLVDDALAAVRDFIAADAVGPWSTPSANKAIQAAARQAGRDPFTVYQIRQTFATWRCSGADPTALNAEACRPGPPPQHPDRCVRDRHLKAVVPIASAAPGEPAPARGTRVPGKSHGLVCTGDRTREVYRFMSVNQARFRVTAMTRMLGVSPSGYYAWCRCRPAAASGSPS